MSRRPRSDHGKAEGTVSGGWASATPVWEVAVGGLGFLLVFGTIAFLAYQAMAVGTRKPAISVSVSSVTGDSGGYVVRFRAQNKGDGTAAAVSIRGELRRGTDVVETSRATLDYLPAAGVREGGLFFQSDPGSYELRLSLEGYADP